MALEAATYLNGLVPTNPVHTDPINQADAHLRLIKAVAQATFPNLSGAVTPSQADLNALTGAGSTVVGGGTVVQVNAAAGATQGSVAVSGNVVVSGSATVDGGLGVNGGAVIYGSGGLILQSGGISIASGGIGAASGTVQASAFAGGTGQLVPPGATILLPNTYACPTGYVSLGSLVPAPSGYVYIQKL